MGDESADELVDDILLGTWFESSDTISEVPSVETDTVMDCQRVGYRFKITNPDGDYVVEQPAYVESDGEQISWLRIMCAGFQPLG